MASLGNALVTKILGHSKAEKAFTPWWDNCQDFMVYGMVMLGLIVAPTAIINSSPLECIKCSPDDTVNCQADKLHIEEGEEERSVWKQDEELFSKNRWWVNKYCLMEAMDRFMLYFPYILLVMALLLVFIQRGFARVLKTSMKMDNFYNLLVKEDGDEKTKSEVEGLELDLEDSRGAIEVSHSFDHSSYYHLSYVLRTIGELVISSALLVWLVVRGVPSIGKKPFILCNVYGTRFECAGHPQQFYMYVTFVVLAILVIYIFCALYNLAWLTFSNLGVLSRVMSRYRILQRKLKGKDNLISDKELLGDLWDIYYNNRDLRLLLDLLAESSGIGSALRILSLFDKSLRATIEPSNVCICSDAVPTVKDETSGGEASGGPIVPIDPDQFHSIPEHSRSNSVIGGAAAAASGDGHVYEEGGPIYAQPNKPKNGGPANFVLAGPGGKKNLEHATYDAVVEFEDAEAICSMFSCIKNMSYLYTVEIKPPTAYTSVQSIRIGEDGEPDFFLSVQTSGRADAVDAAGAEAAEVRELKEFGAGGGAEDEEAAKKKRKKMGVPLRGLEVDQDYWVRICTIVNGRTIAKKLKKIKALQPKKSDLAKNSGEGQ